MVVHEKNHGILFQWLWLGCALAVLFMLIAVNLYRTHGRIAEGEKERLVAQAGIIANELEHQLYLVNSVLDRILTDVRQKRDVVGSRDAVGDYFSALTTVLPGAQSISMAAADGTTIATGPDHKVGQNVRNQTHFMEVKAHPDIGALYLSSPNPGALHSDVIHISRMVPDSEGQFAGIVSIMFDPSYIGAALSSLSYSPGTWGAIRQSAGPAFVFEPASAGTASADHNAHMVAQRTMNPAVLKIDKSLLIEVGRKRSDVFLQWHQDIVFRASVFASICLVSFLAMRASHSARRRSEQQKARTEAILQATLENYQLIVENTTDLVARLDPRGKYIYLNEAFSSIYGKSAKECLGEHFAEKVVEADRSLVDVSFRKLNEPPYVLSFTLRELTMDGVRHFQWTARALVNPQGQTTEIIAIGRDMTEYMHRVGALEHQAYQDFLTGLANRRHFMSMAREELRRASNYAQPTCLLMIDVDHFKHINDAYGHRVGDLMLQSFGNVLLKTLRLADIIARVGGEEFAVLMPETTLDMAIEVASRLKNVIAEHELCIENAPVIRVTASIGVAAWKSGLDLDDLMDMADGVLYQAKHSGRNKICVVGRPEGTAGRQALASERAA